MMKEGKSHRRSRTHPSSCSFGKVLPGPAAGCRAALLCGSDLYPAESGDRVDIVAVAYWVSSNPKWNSPPAFYIKTWRKGLQLLLRKSWQAKICESMPISSSGFFSGSFWPTDFVTGKIKCPKWYAPYNRDTEIGKGLKWANEKRLIQSLESGSLRNV